MSSFVELGKKIYRLSNPREAHRFAVFVARCCLNPDKMRRVEEFFTRDEILSEVVERYPYVYEQVTRAFFYHRSSFEQRIQIVEEHMEFLARRMTREFMLALYGGERLLLWSMPLGAELGELRLEFCVEAGQKKEGLASVMLRLSSGVPVYQIIFWIARGDLVKMDGADENFAMWIGAMQGPNVPDARELIKTLTKKCHACRTKNLILYAAQAVARALGLTKIFAVTNAGYYANNHIRVDRKLKTSFSDFWGECGGAPTSDERFFALPLAENRKAVDEIPSHKRAVYRKRFALLDALDAAVAEKISAFKVED